MCVINKMTVTAVTLLLTTAASWADAGTPRLHSCDGLPNSSALKSALGAVVSSNQDGGFHLNMWATIVSNDGTVCAVAFSGAGYTDQWLASRVISAQKASTANSLSLGKVGLTAASANGKFAISTANLYSPTLPGGSLYGLQFSNPVDPSDAYLQRNGLPDNPADFGTNSDPMIGRPIGGVNVFGGGLGLYDRAKGKVGGLGVSGDTSCTDHRVAWHLRRALNYDWLAHGAQGPINGFAAAFAGDATHPDNIIFDMASGPSTTGFGHPTCPNVAPLSGTLEGVQ